MRTVSAGHTAFAAVMIAVGLFGLIRGDFGPVWEPVPDAVPARQFLIYLCALVSVACGAGLLSPRTAAPAAGVLLSLLLVWLLFFRVPVVVRKPAVEVSWEGCGETAVMVAGAWALYAGLATKRARARLGFATGEQGLRIARVSFGLALIPLGVAHLVYLKETAALVPAWLPWHSAWVYLTGCTYIAAGIAVLTGIRARAAAALTAVQMGLFSVLVWLPIIAAGSRIAFQWSETVLSFALTAAAWVMADSYRGSAAG